MNAIRLRLQRLTWIALVAIFGLALAPAVSHALHAGDAANPFAEVCSATGGKSVPGAAGHHLEKCPLCAQASGALGMPPASAAFLLAEAPLAAIAPQRAVPLAAPHAWTAAQPRAPPVLF